MDILERLQWVCNLPLAARNPGSSDLILEAAREIESLRAKLAEMESCLVFAQQKLLESAEPYDAAAMRIKETLDTIQQAKMKGERP